MQNLKVGDRHEDLPALSTERWRRARGLYLTSLSALLVPQDQPWPNSPQPLQRQPTLSRIQGLEDRLDKAKGRRVCAHTNFNFFLHGELERVRLY